MKWIETNRKLKMAGLIFFEGFNFTQDLNLYQNKGF